MLERKELIYVKVAERVHIFIGTQLAFPAALTDEMWLTSCGGQGSRAWEASRRQSRQDLCSRDRASFEGEEYDFRVSDRLCAADPSAGCGI